MIAIKTLPVWAAFLTAFLVLAGAALTMIGAIGLLRFRSFYERVHAPTLGATLGIGGILLGSMVYFSASETRPVVHEILIALFVTITTPVTMLMLTQATLYRDRAEGKAPRITDAPLQPAEADAPADGAVTADGAATPKKQALLQPGA